MSERQDISKDAKTIARVMARERKVVAFGKEYTLRRPRLKVVSELYDLYESAAYKLEGKQVGGLSGHNELNVRCILATTDLSEEEAESLYMDQMYGAGTEEDGISVAQAARNMCGILSSVDKAPDSIPEEEDSDRPFG